jgi:hypothetical protein
MLIAKTSRKRRGLFIHNLTLDKQFSALLPGRFPKQLAAQACPHNTS